MRQVIVFIAIFAALAVLNGCRRYHGPKPFFCKVLIERDGTRIVGKDEGPTLEKARKEAKDEACSRSCHGDACEDACKKEAVVMAYRCRDRSTGTWYTDGDADK